MDTVGQALDESFGDGPPAPSIESTIEAGRSARRRRQVGSALTACALVAAAGGTAYAVVPRGEAVQPAPASTVTSGPPTPAVHWRAGEVVRLLADGSLLARPGATIVRRVPNPAGVRPPSRSAGAEVRYQGRFRWYLASWVPGDGSAAASVPARQAFPTLESWLADQVAFERGDPTLALVRLGAGGRLEPLPGVTILEQRTKPDLPPRFAPDGAATAVAAVRWHGATWYVLARRLPGSTRPEYFPTAASVAGPSLDQFLDHARRQYGTGGEGLR